MKARFKKPDKKEYNDILEGVLERAAFNMELDEFKEGLECYTMSELRNMLKEERLNFFLTEDELHNKKAKAIDTEFTIKLLNK